MSEHSEQVFLFQWARLMERQCPELKLLFAIPNGAKLPFSRDARGKRYAPQGQRLVQEGLKSGVPDIFLPVARKGHYGLFIEMKVHPNKPTAKQLWWMDQLVVQGYLAAVAYGADEAIAILTDYLEIGER